MTVSLICVVLLAFLCFALGFAVSSARAKYKIMIGSSTDPADPLYKLVRAHGNTVEYAPILALLIYILGQAPQAGWVVWFMLLATASRYLFAAGLIFPKTLANPNPMRLFGALGTYVFGTGLCVALLLQALT